MPSRAQVVEEARSWLDVSWRHQGRSRLGVDCVGLVVAVTGALNISEYDFTAYDRRPNGVSFMHHFADNAQRIPFSEVGDGDIVVFRDGPYPCHCGIASTRYNLQHIIHSHARRRKVMEELLTGELYNKRIAAFHMPGVS